MKFVSVLTLAINVLAIPQKTATYTYVGPDLYSWENQLKELDRIVLVNEANTLQFTELVVDYSLPKCI